MDDCRSDAGGWQLAGRLIHGGSRPIELCRFDEGSTLIASRTTTGQHPAHRVGVYNFGAESRSIGVPLLRLGLSAAEFNVDGEADGVSLHKGILMSPHTPAHSLRIVDLGGQKLAQHV